MTLKGPFLPLYRLLFARVTSRSFNDYIHLHPYLSSSSYASHGPAITFAQFGPSNPF